MARQPEPPPSGPWSDLPPPEKPARPAREPFVRRWREPAIRNWRGLLIVVFLLLVAPFLANWVSHLIMGALPGG